MKENKIIMDILYLIDGIFYKDILNQIRSSEKDFFLCNYNIYKELLKIKDCKYLKIIDKNLINYIYNNDFLKFGVNTKDPLYYTKFIRLYVDNDKYGNTVYHNMTKYIYYSFIREYKLSKHQELNKLIGEFQMISKEVYKSNKYELTDVQSFCRMLVYLLTYLYMNSDLLIENDNLFKESYQIMSEESFFENMKLNGAFDFKGLKEEDDTKIYYIEKAIKEVLNNKKK